MLCTPSRPFSANPSSCSLLNASLLITSERRPNPQLPAGVEIAEIVLIGPELSVPNATVGWSATASVQFAHKMELNIICYLFIKKILCRIYVVRHKRRVLNRVIADLMPTYKFI
jgi:hypothetical protein